MDPRRTFQPSKIKINNNERLLYRPPKGKDFQLDIQRIDIKDVK